MNHYEILVIVSGKFAENEVEPVFTKIEGLLKKHGASIHYRQNLDRKRLAYPIKHESYGYYFLVEFDAESVSVGKIDREFKLSHEILRHHLEKRKTVGKPKSFERKQSLEQEAFGKRSEGRTLGLEPEKVEVDTAAKQTQTVQTRTADENALPPVQIPVAQVEDELVQEEPKKEPVKAKSKKVVAPAEPEKEAEVAQTTDETVAAPSKKKVNQKVSYEDLDKKLDEILKNDML